MKIILKRILTLALVIEVIPFTVFAAVNTNSGDYSSTSGTNYNLVANDMGITSVSNISIGVWVKAQGAAPNSDLNDHFLAMLQTGETSKCITYELKYVNNGGVNAINWLRGRHNIDEVSLLYNVTLGTTNWHRIWGTYDGTNMRLYLDGTLVAGPTAASGDGSVTRSPTFGISGNGTNQKALAYEDEIEVYNTAVSATTITNDWNTPATISPSTTGLLAYYQNESNTTSDSTSNGYNFTTTGTIPQTTDVPFTGIVVIFNGGDDDWWAWFISNF